MPCTAVITIPHNSPQQTLGAFLADLVNTMSNTCPALRTFIAHLLIIFSPNILLPTTHHTSRETLNVASTTLRPVRGLSRVSQSIYSGNKCHHREVGSSAQCPLCPAFVIPVCINWPSVGHHPISARCTKVSVSCHHTQFMVCIIIMTECCSQSSRYAFAINHVTRTGVQTMLCKF